MADGPTNLQTALDQINAEIALITLHPKPSYSIDGQSVSWGEHYRNLLSLREAVKLALIDEQGPYEQHVQGST